MRHVQIRFYIESKGGKPESCLQQVQPQTDRETPNNSNVVQRKKKIEQHPWRLHKQEPQFPSRLQTNSPRLIFFTKALSPKGSQLGLKTDKNIPVPTRSVFYFCPYVSVFVGSRFRIYGSRNEVSSFVSEESRFYMELTHIYSVFHLVFNLHKICLKIDMLKNISITKYAC